jgi:hypothetical protein
MNVEVLAIDRRLIDLEIAGMHDRAAGVCTAMATQSGMLCVTRRNSTSQSPTRTRCRGCTGTSRSPGSIPCSSSLGLNSANVSGVA